MRFVQQLLVAPAAFGLLATGANAAELNINGVSDYAASADQVTSVTQFSDVYPTDWAYQALAGLVETYGCVAGYPNGTFRGNRAMTRYEAAALLNACLDRVTEVTDELRRLMAEFETELAIVKGRVDGLEAIVGELAATQFSTTTKLKGYTAWVAGAVDDNGSKGDALTLNYDLRLALKTSFTGEDMLTTVLRGGNFDSNATFGNGLTFMETAMGSENAIKVGRLFYTFPVGDALTVTAGPVVRTDDAGMYAGYATFYPADLMLDFFTYGGAWGTNNLGGTGSGIGAVYEIGNGFSVSSNYVARNGNDSSKGLGTDESAYTSSTQLFYSGEILDGSFLAQVGYAVDRGVGFTMAMDTGSPTNTESYSVAAAWKSADAGFMPSISTGYSSTEDADSSAEYEAWYVGLEWSDVLIDGNSLGFAYGETPNSTADDDSSALWELFYSMPVTDNITVTPAIFGISDDGPSGVDQFGGVVKTTFTF